MESFQNSRKLSGPLHPYKLVGQFTAIVTQISAIVKVLFLLLFSAIII